MTEVKAAQLSFLFHYTIHSHIPRVYQILMKNLAIAPKDPAFP